MKSRKWGNIFLFAATALFLFSYFISSEHAPAWLQFLPREISAVFRDSETQWMVALCLVIYFTLFLILEWRRPLENRSWLGSQNIWLVVMMVLALGYYVFAYNVTSHDVQILVLLAGMTLGKGAKVSLRADAKNFLIGLILLLAFSSFWHLDMSNNYYHGPRWMGLWNNPNDYGMLMSVGVLLAAGLFADRKWKMADGKILSVKSAILLVAAMMVAIGLLFSYSRGSWLGTAIGLLYLVKAHGKFHWKYILPIVAVTTVAIYFFWNSTPDEAQWYVKRMDFARPSAQHRVTAWRAGFEIMRDYPFGVGWNKAVETYEKNYFPPEGSAAALTTNDYLMLGAQLGIPALVCFMAYVWLSLRGKIDRLEAYPTLACRAAVIAMLVEFWFDGGLFKLATASVFWILLELGSSNSIPSSVIQSENDR